MLTHPAFSVCIWDEIKGKLKSNHCYYCYVTFVERLFFFIWSDGFSRKGRERRAPNGVDAAKLCYSKSLRINKKKIDAIKICYLWMGV